MLKTALVRSRGSSRKTFRRRSNFLWKKWTSAWHFVLSSCPSSSSLNVITSVAVLTTTSMLEQMEKIWEGLTLDQGVNLRRRTSWKRSWKTVPQNTRAMSSPRIRLLSVLPRNQMRLAFARLFDKASCKTTTIRLLRNSSRKSGMIKMIKHFRMAINL